MAKFIRSAKTALLYCGLSREDYEKIAPLIAERNFSFADILSIAMVMFGLIFLFSQILSNAAILFPYYFLILSGLLLFILGKTLMSRTDRGRMLYRYLQICVVFAFAMILSAQGTNREQPSVSIIVFLALLPLTINDRPLRMAAVVYGAAILYLFCSARVKIPAVFKADVMNTLTFTTLGMAVYLLISNRNIHEIYLRQQAVESDRLREKMRAAELANAAKIEAGKIEIVSAAYKLSSVLNDVSNMILFKARSKELAFQVEVDRTIPDILYGDEVRVRQIITNLLTNAVKYTEQGSVRLSVSTGPGRRREGGLLELVICVRDTGIGIREEEIDKLFSKFERLDLEHNSSVEGAGLGLAITKRLLDLMGGTIYVQSVYGVGSSFTVRIPQTVVSTEPVGDFREKFEKSVQAAKARKEFFRALDARILLVDDTRMNLTVAAGLLKNTGMAIDAVTSGEEAVRLARTTPYDLILMDQRMPLMDGTEALRRIRAQEDGANPDTPVICLTADAVSGAKERYLAQGFTDYLSKPIDSAALENTLLKYLPADKIARQGTEDGAAPETVSAASLAALGVDEQTGLAYCGGDEALYRSMLREFVREAGEKASGMQTYYAAGDWENYSVLVHALKSTSRMIGADGLSALAATLEAAAERADAETIRRDVFCQ